MARRRDYKAEYARRQQRAREQGFRSYYARRVAGVPKGQRARARGHRGRADFLASLHEGDLVVLANQLGSIDVYEDSRGAIRYRRIDKIVIPDRGGPERHYTLRNLTRRQLEATIRAEERIGVIFSPAPSLDQRRILSDLEIEGGY